jgi:hypothetical protein
MTITSSLSPRMSRSNGHIVLSGASDIKRRQQIGAEARARGMGVTIGLL